MENDRPSKHTIAFGIALALASGLNAVLVVVKEKSPAVQAGLQRLTGHHWISHAVIVLGFFFLCGSVLARMNGGAGIQSATNRLLGWVFGGVFLGGSLILGFYLLAD